MPMSNLVAYATLGHLLELLNGHLELSLTKGRNSRPSHRKRFAASLSVSTGEILGLLGLESLLVGLLLLLKDRAQDLSAMLISSSISDS